MPDKRCCCGHPGCLIFEDDFNRPNSTNPGSNWLEDVGDSNIFNETLRLPAGARVICTVPHPERNATCYALVELKDIQEGDRYRLIVDYIDDEDDPLYDTYLFGEYVAGAGGVGILKVGSGVGNIVTYKHSVVSGHMGADDYLIVCRSQTGLYAAMSISTFAWACVGLAGFGAYEDRPWKAALENPGSSTVRFDNFEYWQHEHTNPNCPGCECDCEGWCVGKNLLLTFEAYDDCGCLDAATIALAWDVDRAADWVWNGAAELPHWECPEQFPKETYEFDLKCGATPEEWQLRIVQFTGACAEEPGWIHDGGQVYAYPSSYTCHPFSLTFGPFTCSWSCEPSGCYCTYYIVITEQP